MAFSFTYGVGEATCQQFTLEYHSKFHFFSFHFISRVTCKDGETYFEIKISDIGTYFKSVASDPAGCICTSGISRQNKQNTVSSSQSLSISTIHYEASPWYEVAGPRPRESAY